MLLLISIYAIAEEPFAHLAQPEVPQEVNGVKPWERAWTLPELRHAARSNWSLAADVGVCFMLFVQHFFFHIVL